MDSILASCPDGVTNSKRVLRDQFVEHVNDVGFKRELKRLVRQTPHCSLLCVGSEAIRWNEEGKRQVPPSSAKLWRNVAHGRITEPPMLKESSELSEIKELLKQQQAQIDEISKRLDSL